MPNVNALTINFYINFVLDMICNLTSREKYKMYFSKNILVLSCFRALERFLLSRAGERKKEK